MKHGDGEARRKDWETTFLMSLNGRTLTMLETSSSWARTECANYRYLLSYDAASLRKYDSKNPRHLRDLRETSVWDTTRGTNRLVAVGQQMSAVPDESCFTYELTDDNSYLLTWSNFFLNRDTNQPITASIELKRNGDWIVTSNEVAVSHFRILPFAHNGFGQDEDWVRANFTNVEEILSVGYSQWVDAQVGYNLTNGLYKFVATFAEDPPECVNLTVGDLSVAITNAGDYAFLLQKGPTYRVGMGADVPFVNFWAVDDLGGGEPSLLDASQDVGDWAQWTIAGEGFEVEHDADDRFSRICWLPQLWADSAVPRHLWPDEFPITFIATLFDFSAGCGDVTYEWHGGNDWLTLTPENGVSTRASLNRDNLPNCGELSLSVTARFGDKELTSYLTGVTVGTVDPNGLALSVSAPEVVFLNDDGRESRYYHATVTASCPFATNATVSLTHTGTDGFSAFRDEEGGRLVDPFTNVVVSVAADGRVTTHDFWFKCSQIGRGRLEARTVGEGARQTVAKRDYTVIEPIAELVTHETTSDGRQVNPSRLIYGTNAWLAVSFNGDFPTEKIVWRVVSGPARLVEISGCRACVEAAAFTMPDCQTVVMGQRNWPTILAHELGHILGLQDIYVLDRTNQSCRMPGYFEPACAEIFGDARDWGADDGRGFYSSRVTHGVLVERLLMNGIYSGGCDIPSGTVLGWPPVRRNVFDIQPRKVGAAHTAEGSP